MFVLYAQKIYLNLSSMHLENEIQFCYTIGENDVMYIRVGVA